MGPLLWDFRPESTVLSRRIYPDRRSLLKIDGQVEKALGRKPLFDLMHEPKTI
jgi:hypothetical protein